jgi:DNA modification methylase
LTDSASQGSRRCSKSSEERYQQSLEYRKGNRLDPLSHIATGNNHPTVKPVALMRYLIQLVTPANSHIVDPFTGSGTTGMAATELGHRFTGIEQDTHYVGIANKRIEGWLNKDKDITAKDSTATGQIEPFDRLFEQD